MSDNYNMHNQQQLAGCLAFVAWQTTQTSYLSLHLVIQKGIKHKIPVKKKRQQHHDQVTLPDTNLI